LALTFPLNILSSNTLAFNAQLIFFKFKVNLTESEPATNTYIHEWSEPSCLYSAVAAYHCTLAGTHFQTQRGQEAELPWVAGTKMVCPPEDGHPFQYQPTASIIQRRIITVYGLFGRSEGSLQNLWVLAFRKAIFPVFLNFFLHRRLPLHCNA